MGLFGKKDELQIITFSTYGTASHLYIKGRALEDERIDLLEEGLTSVLKNTWKRWGTDEIKNTSLVVELSNGKRIETKTDSEGYYLIEEEIKDLKTNFDAKEWLSYTVSYGNTSFKNKISQENRFYGEMLIPSNNAEYGVISDIDDTILHTGVASVLKWRAILNTFFKNVKNRIPLEGAADFYHELYKGKSGESENPMFYVSNSPWNLYRYLQFFLEKNNFPKGPVLLRNLREPFDKGSKTERPHKDHEIRNILKTYPDMNFVLIGDCGEHDATIYKQIATEFPNRILAIYLRSVAHKRKMKRIKDLFSDYAITPVLLVKTSAEASDHAKKNGLL